MRDDAQPEFRPPERELSAPGRPSAGHAPDHQRQLLEYLDGRTSANESQAMREHLADCVECRTLAREWSELDGQLTAHFTPPLLSMDFSARVWTAIQSLPPETTAFERPASVSPESDWPAAWARRRRHFVWTFLPAALDHLGYAFAIILAVCLSVRFMPAFLNTWPHDLQRTWLALLAYGLGASAPVALFVLGWLARRPLGRLLTFH